jgi:hypothetical protein
VDFNESIVYRKYTFRTIINSTDRWVRLITVGHHQMEVFMADSLNETAIFDTYQRYHNTCIYCGFDGRGFDSWMQLSIDHIRPRNAGGNDDPENLVVACRQCNSITGRMKFLKTATREEILREKRERVAKRRKDYYDYWSEHVAPNYLNRPLPKLR